MRERCAALTREEKDSLEKVQRLTSEKSERGPVQLVLTVWLQERGGIPGAHSFHSLVELMVCRITHTNVLVDLTAKSQSPVFFFLKGAYRHLTLEINPPQFNE